MAREGLAGSGMSSVALFTWPICKKGGTASRSCLCDTKLCLSMNVAGLVHKLILCLLMCYNVISSSVNVNPASA